MDINLLLFTETEHTHWEAEAKHRGLSVRKELTANGSYFVAYVVESKGIESIYGLFADGGYIGHSVSKVNSARMILKSFKNDIVKLSKVEFVLTEILND